MTDVPVHVGLNPPDWEPEARHGADGVHGAWDGVYRPPEPGDAVNLISKALVMPSSRIICLGPLTNLAAALRGIGGSSFVQTSQVFALGGTKGAPTGLRDTNRNADTSASAECSEIVSWVSMRDAAECSAVDVAQMKDSADYSWIEPFAVRTAQSWGWIDRFPVYDVAVVARALNFTSDLDELIYHAVA
ncbi:inosine-uridine nucleoside N-ribohydrolase [Corynebacterium suicordis]|nr:inosine-uridine nucleoside N-ribohydrolase [Corynebacterium suicordis]